MARKASSFWGSFFTPAGRDNRLTFFLRQIALIAAPIIFTILIILAILFAYYNIPLRYFKINPESIDPKNTYNFFFALLIPYSYLSFCALSKRLHDIGIPALYAGIITSLNFIIYIPFHPSVSAFAQKISPSDYDNLITFINYTSWPLTVIYIALFFIPGQKHANRYGPVPGQADMATDMRISVASD